MQILVNILPIMKKNRTTWSDFLIDLSENESLILAPVSNPPRVAVIIKMTKYIIDYY